MAKDSNFWDRGIEYITFLKENPCIAALELLNVDLPEPQRLILRDMWFKPFTLVTAGRGSGKSYLLSVMACLHAMLKPGEKIGLLSSSYRQSRMVFDEVINRYRQSPILREACVRKPIKGSDQCYLYFRSVGDNKGSSIVAVPLGTGDKIRGLRCHVLLVDEFAQVDEDIFNTVIRPMGATVSNPMENVRRIRRLKEQLKFGFISEDEYEAQLSDGYSNKIVGTSSAYFQFNHMYKRILAYQEEIDRGSEKYAVHFVSYRDMPEGFLDRDNIESAKITLSRVQFRTEYEGIWESDSDGVFKASLLEEAKSHSAAIRIKGDPNKQYVMGIDPARSSDAFAIVIIEVSAESFVCHAYQAIGKKFPEMAGIIHNFSKKFNIVRAYMDAGAGGGGVAIKDILASTLFPSNKILDIEDEEYANVEGQKILKMFDPKPKTIASANFSALNLIEQKKLYFPRPSALSNAGSELDSKEKVYEEIKEMLRQMMSIIITETKTGQAHFDIPATGKGSRKKDLYSAFILASLALYEEVVERPDNKHPIHDFGGIVIPRGDRGYSRDSIFSSDKIFRRRDGWLH